MLDSNRFASIDRRTEGARPMEGVHAAIVTHFDADLAVDTDAVAAQVDRLIEEGIQGIVVCGTMGEANSLSAPERDRVMRTAVAASAGRVPVTVGVSSVSAAQSSRYARDAAAAGADGVMCLPPLLYRADPAELLAFFIEVGAASDLPLMVYNNPEASGVDLVPAQLAEIMAAVPTAASIKECSGDARRIAELIGITDGVDVFVGGDDWVLEGAATGAVGWVSGVAVVLPGACAQLWEAAVAGELAEARRIYQRLLPLARFDMTSKLVQYFKAALDALGIDGGPCRPPRRALSPAELDAVGAATSLAASTHA
jgi:dihydrodipicolinate synthase/N-acetylneuraminate lyase